MSHDATCPTCAQDLDAWNTIADLRAQVEELKVKLSDNDSNWHDDVRTMHALAEDLEKATAHVETLQGEVCKLRGVLEMLEWVPDVALRINQPHHCPWCGGRHRHLDDCPRQAALGGDHLPESGKMVGAALDTKEV